ncbi:MAG: DUF4124 domain-containing protein [Rhodocyclaceae bacterium]|nr:MAG: DUF4124 domain-containing protein [Rhodocyclaceae bacterium]
MRIAFTTALAAILILALNAAAHAQGVYKSIGPDGKVTYSDQPPSDRATRMDGSVAPAAPPGSSATEPAASRGTGAKKAIAGSRPPAEATPAIQPVDPALESAIIGVLGYEDLVMRAEQICTRVLPTSYQRYGSAADSWKARNGSLVAQARRALTDTANATARQLIEVGIRNKNAGLLAQVEAAPAASKITWCDRSFDEIAKGVMDAHNNPKFMTPLANYRMR